MQISLRPARAEDFAYCERLYFSGMAAIIQELQLDRATHMAGFREQWKRREVQIITLAGDDTGWIQYRSEAGGIFVAQLFVDSANRDRGIGTAVMKRVISEAGDKPVLLAVVKINRAVKLYERLGFQTTHEDEHKFYMRRSP